MPDPTSNPTPDERTSNNDGDTPAPPPTLSYASTDLHGGADANLITVAKCANTPEAAMRIGALEAEGITATMVNDNFASLGYGNMTAVEVQVRKDQLEQAKEVLRVALSDEVEPADIQPDTMPSLDPDGDPLPLQVVGRFDTIRALRDAALLLESARIRSVSPKLVPRNGPAGEGNRFHLKVAEDDADRAEGILADLEEEHDEEELRCPKCGSWRIYAVGNLMPTIKWFLRMGDKPVTEMDCLECKYRAPRAEFEKGK